MSPDEKGFKENSGSAAGSKGPAEEAPGEKEKREAKEIRSAPLLPLDFSTFILSLSTSVLMNLGLVENPVTKKVEKEPDLAKQTIDLIELLKEKTKGNLSEEENKLIDGVLYELRLQYVKVVG